MVALLLRARDEQAPQSEQPLLGQNRDGLHDESIDRNTATSLREIWNRKQIPDALAGALRDEYEFGLGHRKNRLVHRGEIRFGDFGVEEIAREGHTGNR